MQGGIDLHGGGSPCPCDLGVKIGRPGRPDALISTTSFVISSAELDLDLSLFAGEGLGVRLAPRSSKLGGSFLLSPEPGSAALLGVGLALLAVRARATQRQRRAI
jgi:hypothetical protein